MIVCLSHYFWPLEKCEAHIKTVVIPTPFTGYGCKYQIKAESLQLKLELKLVSFISLVVYRAKNCANIPIFTV